MNNTIYIVLGVVFAVYLVITMMNRKKSNSRKSKKFMEDYQRKNRKDKES